LGLVGSLTRGIVSALNREIRGMAGRPIRGLIQTDASVSPGNSGCPLLDRAGRLIGMVTMTYMGKEGNAGPSFAIPVNSIKKIVSPMIENSRLILP
jgi:S1-C subfamily serine protease